MLYITGIVVHGEKRGRVLGYPTANIDIKKKKLPITPGIFAGWTIVEKKKFITAFYIPESLDKVEAHLLDYSGESLYGVYLELEIVEKVSEVEHHDSDEELIAKIKKDVEMVRDVLGK